MKQFAISLGFRLPRKYHRLFLFKSGRLAAKLEFLSGPSRVLIQTHTARKSTDPSSASLCLDWIQETIEAVRQEAAR
jgi:hypothetical protein